jgi:hypothetical protein
MKIGLSPKQLTEQLGVKEYTQLIGKIENKYRQKFMVISVARGHNSATCVVELEDNTRHTVDL